MTKRKVIHNPMREKGPNLWFLVETHAGLQNKATWEIRRAGYRAVLILKRFTKIHKRTGKPLTKVAPALDQYIFVRMPRKDLNFDKLRQCKSVARIMAIYNAEGELVPFPVRRQVVADLLIGQRKSLFDSTENGARRRGEVKRDYKSEVRATYIEGMTVRVDEGPFASFPGIVSGVDNRGFVLVEVSIFGRPTPVTLEPGQIEITDSAGKVAA